MNYTQNFILIILQNASVPFFNFNRNYCLHYHKLNARSISIMFHTNDLLGPQYRLPAPSELYQLHKLLNNN